MGAFLSLVQIVLCTADNYVFLVFKVVLEIIKTDLLEIKRKYPSERKTEIAVDFSGDIEDEDLIPVGTVRK